MHRLIYRLIYPQGSLYQRAVTLSRRQRPWAVYPDICLITLFLSAGMIWAAVAHATASPTTPLPASVAGGGAQDDARDGSLLEPGKPIERELKGGETHSYSIALAAGQFCSAVVEQRGINVVLELSAPDGKKIAEVDGPNDTLGPESVALIAEAAGSYRLDVRPLLKDAGAGRYEVKLEEVRATTAQDRTRISAQSAYAEAMLLFKQRTAESLRKAEEKFRETIPLWQALGMRRMEAIALTITGFIHAGFSEYQKALDYYNRALPAWRAAGDRRMEATTLNNIGLVYDHLGERQKALDYFDQSLPLSRAANDRELEATTLVNMGTIYEGSGNTQKVLDYFNQALPLIRAVGNRAKEAILLNNIGLTYNGVSERQKALDYYNRALPLSRANGDRESEAVTLNNIGSVYDDSGDYQKALDYYKQALTLIRTVGNRSKETVALNNIGKAYVNLGERQKGLEFYTESLAIARATGYRSMEATTLNNLGDVYRDTGEPQKALDYYTEALAINRAIGRRRIEAVNLNNIAFIYNKSGEPQKALDYYNQSLTLRRAVSDRAGEALTLYNIARAERGLNRLGEARQRIEAALAIVESLRTKVASQGLRTAYLASVQRYYELAIDVLMRLHQERPTEGFEAAALQISERARARSLLDLLAEARADIRQGVDPALLERERALQQTLDARAVAQMRLLSGKYTAEQAAAAAAELNRLTAEYEEVKAQIRQSSPRYAALVQPRPLDVKEIQTKVLDPETLLLEYALGEEKSFLWAVTPTSIKSFELVKRAEIDEAARRVYELLTARNKFVPNETLAQREKRISQADAEYAQASAVLSRMLLGPVASELGSNRLVIVGEGALQYIPFGALPIPKSQESGVKSQESKTKATTGAPTERVRQTSDSGLRTPDSGLPLIVEHEVVSLPSASVLAVMRQETAGRKPAAKAVAVLADPVFQRDDARLEVANRGRTVRATESEVLADATRSAREAGLEDFVRLPFSRQEAEAIMRLVPEGRKLRALDFNANRATATGEEIGRYTVVHFATHGLINSQNPELSGVVLSLVDERGQPQDGFLRLHEIYNLRLGAELVVLSACQTALGKEIKGEGLVGLTRGFMYAGAPRVMASLWRIDDRATAELMRRFYEEMLVKGRRPAASLRAAQVSMWKDKRWAAPHYWAAFTLQGEWK